MFSAIVAYDVKRNEIGCRLAGPGPQWAVAYGINISYFMTVTQDFRHSHLKQ